MSQTSERGDRKRQHKPTLAVFKFASCDGCQLSLLDAEDELLQVADEIEIAHFLEARSRVLEGPYDIGLVEGSITTPHDRERIQEIRRQCRYLVTIGACATSGGIQALRNWASVDDFISQVYARPEYIESLRSSTGIADHVAVDFELRGCPINQRQLIELITSLLMGRIPRVPRHSVCLECKQRGTVCVAVARGIACLGPVTQAGCQVICPAFGRECYGCFGPKENANVASLAEHYIRGSDQSLPAMTRLLRSFNGYAAEFRGVSEELLRDSARELRARDSTDTER